MEALHCGAEAKWGVLELVFGSSRNGVRSVYCVLLMYVVLGEC